MIYLQFCTVLSIHTEHTRCVHERMWKKNQIDIETDNYFKEAAIYQQQQQNRYQMKVVRIQTVVSNYLTNFLNANRVNHS